MSFMYRKALFGTHSISEIREERPLFGIGEKDSVMELCSAIAFSLWSGYDTAVDRVTADD